ncbi:MAG: hypothetical protein ACE5HW_05175, partial [Candidatus Methanofastidiosia archaeon]
MRKINKRILLFIFGIFVLTVFLYDVYDSKRRETIISRYFVTENKFESPSNITQGICFDGENLWLANSDTKLIYKISPQTFEVLESFKTPAVKPAGLAWDGEHLWNADFI